MKTETVVPHDPHIPEGRVHLTMHIQLQASKSGNNNDGPTVMFVIKDMDKITVQKAKVTLIKDNFGYSAQTGCFGTATFHLHAYGEWYMLVNHSKYRQVEATINLDVHNSIRTVIVYR